MDPVRAAIVLFLALPLAAQSLDTCRASFDGAQLVIANSHFQRTWRLDGPALRPISFLDLSTQTQWLAPPSASPAPPSRRFTLKTTRTHLSPVEAESLLVELSSLAPSHLTYRFQLFPAARGVSVTVQSTPSSAASTEAANVSGIEQERKAPAPDPLAAAFETLALAPRHILLTQVELLDQTDIHNQLAHERHWLLQTNESLRLPGVLFFAENPLTRNGLVFLQHAPLPHVRPVKTPADLLYDARAHRLALLDHGYTIVTLAYNGGEPGRIAALQSWQRQLRQYDPTRDGRFLSNTWGDRSRDARINDAFMRREIQAGARLGVDVIQIDDGWEQGRTANSASAAGKGPWTGFWAADPNFWNVDAVRFPHGLQPIVHLAAQSNMQFGLWFAPDSSNDFANWQRDAARLLQLHRTLGINYFKIDGVKATSPSSEQNLKSLFDRVLGESRGRVTFDLDVTAEVRPGYFGAPRPGPLFVENRYTDWHRYWPHQTLRNLWTLAHYVDPLRLRFEFLNVARNAAQYPGDPLAPALYTPASLFASVMIANPLGWFEISNLPPAYFQQLPPLVALWKQHRPRMHAARILPVGSAPDGTSWTGFVAVAEDGREAWAILFRELNPSSSWSLEIPFAAPSLRAEVLSGAGAASYEQGRLKTRIDSQLGYLWVHLRP